MGKKFRLQAPPVLEQRVWEPTFALPTALALPQPPEPGPFLSQPEKVHRLSRVGLCYLVVPQQWG
jgi:hypothetical protein